MRLIRKAILFGAHDLRLVEEDLPQPNGKQVLVQTELTALSTGTDLANYEGRSTEVPGAPDYPRQVGYSNVGLIRDCGPEATRWKAGQRVFSTRPHQSAYVADEDELLIPVPPSVTPEDASLAYLAQLGMASLRRVAYEAGERVAVVGLGVIGLCTVALANTMGAQVVAVANSELRRLKALELGADSAWLPGASTPAEIQADVVVLTANTWDAFREAVGLLRQGGRIAVLSFPGRAEPPPSFNPLDPAWMYQKQITIAGSGFSATSDTPEHQLRFTLRRNLDLVFDYLRRGRLVLEPVITHRFPAERIADAYELARARRKEMMGVIFDWRLTGSSPEREW